MTCALREKQKLAEAGYENVGVAFNASPELLVHPDFFDRLVWEANIDDAQITIEVLETLISAIWPKAHLRPLPFANCMMRDFKSILTISVLALRACLILPL